MGQKEPPVRFELTTFCLRGRRINRFAKVAVPRQRVAGRTTGRALLHVLSRPGAVPPSAHRCRRDSIIAVPRFVAAEAWVRFPVSAFFSFSSSSFFFLLSLASFSFPQPCPELCSKKKRKKEKRQSDFGKKHD